MTAFTVDYHGGRRAEVGDGFLKPRTVYRVVAMREVESRQWPDRWRYEVEKVGTRATWDLTPGPDRLAAFGFDPAAYVSPLASYGPEHPPPGHPGHERCNEPTCEGCAG